MINKIKPQVMLVIIAEVYELFAERVRKLIPFDRLGIAPVPAEHHTWRLPRALREKRP